MSEKWKPARYQSAGVRWLMQRRAAALLWDPGLRKTSCALAAFCKLQKMGGANKALIIAPLRVAQLVWAHTGEVGKWQDFEHLRVSLLHGAGKDDALEEDADLYVINPDGLPWLTSEGRMQQLLRRGVDHLLVDELSQFKDARTRRFKLLKPWLPRFNRRWGFTGSPAANGLIDLFGQIYVLDMGAALGRYITHYRSTYFYPTGYGGYTFALQEGAEKKIYRQLKPVASSKRAEDYLDLPPLVEQNLYVTLSPKVRKLYDDLEKDLIAQLDRVEIVASNAAVASGKCRQVASGGVYRDLDLEESLARRTDREAVHLHDEKTKALADLVAELQGQPLLVLYEFHHDLERIRRALGDVPAINGRTRQADLVRIVAEWNAGKLPVLCGHPKAMGHGLNLQDRGNHMAWYSLPWSFELYDQSVRRLYRSGQTNRVVVHRLLARDTVDEALIKALASKKRTQNDLFDALKAYARNRKEA